MKTEYLNFFKRFPERLLEYIIQENIITKSEICDFHDVFAKFSSVTLIIHREIFDPNYKKELKYDCYGMDDYFMVSMKPYEGCSANNYKYKELIRDIKKRFKYCFDKQEGYIHIHKSHFEEFITLYHDRDDIYWATICKNKCIIFNDEILEKYGHILYWSQLQKNPGVNWTFDLIEKKKDTLNWGIISSYPFLKWNKITIDKYKDYLIFSLGEEDWQKVIFNKRMKNNKGQSFELEYVTTQNNFDFKLKGSLSLCETINWTEEILASFLDYWDWKELCSNESIRWNFDLIGKFEAKINFKILSSNKSVEWNYEIIDKYHNKLDWAELSFNPSLLWSLELLEKYENDWHWIPQKNNWYWDEYEQTKPSISTNKAIKWTVNMLERFYLKIDFWRISLNGNLSEDSIIQFQNEFDRKEKCDFIYHKWSDSRTDEHIVKNGWENLNINKNITFSKSILDFLYKRKVIITYSTGNLAHDGEVVDEEIRLLELFKEKDFIGIQLQDLIDNELTWGGLIFNNTFINKHLFRTIIKPFLTRENVIVYLNSLKELIDIET